jgi:hypothetical protein
LAAGAATVRQPAGEADAEADPAAAAVLVEEPAAVVLVWACELWLVLLPQPAAPRTMRTARQALRTGSEQSRSLHCDVLKP